MSRPRTLRERTAAATRDRRVVTALQRATWRKVDARVAALGELRDADGMRELAADIRRHVIENLPHYLEQFVDRITRNGARVHRAADADAARRIVVQIAGERSLELAVKSKSMTTEEVSLNAALEAAGVRVVETDLGEFVVQLDGDRPSHITAPIIHKDRRQVACTMARELGRECADDPAEMVRVVREHLRGIFRRCDLGITGVNFAIAETGTLCLLTNEGNGRMTVTRPKVHVALLGIEKIIPRMCDLPVFLKLMARCTTGQPMGSYTTFVSGPRQPGDCDGPGELHVVLLDNGRSDVLAGPLPEVLTCVRCGACLNACPVYRNVGGHAYDSVCPGPIGSLVTPLLGGGGHEELPRVSTLCGACKLACPVKIDIPELLVRLRGRFRDRLPAGPDTGPLAYARGSDWLRRGEWLETRDLPRVARSFRELWDAGLGSED